MLDYLATVFGDGIEMFEYTYPAETPMYIRDGYTPHRLMWDGNVCIILTPTATSWRLPVLKKQLQNFQDICEYPCALGLAKLTSLQRRNLMENRIPFVSEAQQVYLPFWGCAFAEKLKTTRVTEKMAPSTQLVFLYLYYLEERPRVNLSLLARELGLSKASCTRAVDDLLSSKLIGVQSEGRIKWIFPAYEKTEYLKRGYERLKSPVERCIYVDTPPLIPGSHRTGLLALSDISMVGATEQDGAIAIGKKDMALISEADMRTEQEYRDFGGYIVEVWNYDPAMLTDGKRVDDISLLLSLAEHKNERVQMGLDEIRERHHLPLPADE